MNFPKLSLRIRIFLAMILLTLLAFIIITIVTNHQYKERAQIYHAKRLGRKEKAIRKSIDYELLNTSFSLEKRNLPFIFRDKIHELVEIHGLDIDIYDIDGNLLISSYKNFNKNTDNKKIGKEIREQLSIKLDHHIIEENINKQKTQSSFTYINDKRLNNIGILSLIYIQDDTEQEQDLNEFLSNISYAYILVFLIAIALAYILSSYITRSIQTVSEKIKQTRLNKRNEKIILGDASSEISLLVDSYNLMIDELEDSAKKLAQSEREQAWREMAKQVAHEIKNPLTPMRLSVQNFERKFDINDPKIKEKVNDYSETLIQQIDTMSGIASAFSDFAKMPTQNKEMLNVVEVVKRTLDIFPSDYISFFSLKKSIELQLDKNQLTRVVNNLVKNAVQALEDQEHPKVEVTIVDQNDHILIKVADNGKGIKEALKSKVFEPKFTTKSSGMGLGLPMVKNIVETYNGNITFSSKENAGTVFTVELPKK